MNVEQRSGRRAARCVLVLLTLLGLLGMHGLPDAMGAPAGAPAMQMQAVAVVGAAELGIATGAGETLRAGLPPTGCAMDHAGCVAVLRDVAHQSAAGPAGAVTTAPGAPNASPVPDAASRPRAPPDVSLIGLGISRT